MIGGPRTRRAAIPTLPSRQHQLRRGLAILHIPQPGYAVELVSGTPAPLTGGATYGMDEDARALRSAGGATDGAVSYMDPVAIKQIATRYTAFIWADLGTVAVSQGWALMSLPNGSAGATWQQPYHGLGFTTTGGSGSQGHLEISIAINSSSRETISSGLQGTVVRLAGLHRYVIRNDGVNLAFFRDGVKIATVAGSSTVPYLDPYGRVAYFNRSATAPGEAPQSGARGTMFALWHRALSDAEVAELDADPRALVRSSRRPLAYVAAAPAADHLAVTTQPSSPIASGATHATQPVVAVRDASNATVTGDTSTVTAQLIVVTGTATPLGTLTKAAVAGVADFAGNGLGGTAAGGATAKWRFTDGALTLAETSVFTITATPAAPSDPFLVIAGITVPVVAGSAVERRDELADGGRGYAGQLVTDLRYSKRIWQLTTELLTTAEADALVAATANRAHVTVSGLAPGASVTCEVIVGDGGYVTVGSVAVPEVLRAFALAIVEV